MTSVTTTEPGGPEGAPAAPAEGGSAEEMPRVTRAVLPTDGRFTVVIDRSTDSIVGRVREALQWRDLLWMLVQRDVKVRYRQTAFGVIWAVAVPLMTMAVYWVVFDRLGRIGPEGIEYPLFLFPAMLVWNYFQSSTGRASNALKHDAAILSKVYFPRLLLPVSNITSPLVDFAIGLVLLAVILAIYRHPPTWEMALMPAFLLLAMVSAAGVGMGLSVLNAHYRDVGHFLPVLLHLWFFCSPVLYSTSDLVPENFRLIYALNPMSTACEGVRAYMLGQPIEVTLEMGLVSCGVALAMLVGGLWTFMRLEQTVTDVI